MTARLTIALALFVAACAGSGDGAEPAESSSTPNSTSSAVSTTVAVGEPVATVVTTSTSSTAVASADTVSADTVGPEPRRGGVLRYLLDAETDTWDIPNSNCATACITIMRQVADPMLAVAEDGTLEPFLLESFAVNDDFTVWTLVMRDGVVFHDGSPADGAAVQRSLREMAQGVVQGQVYVKLADGLDSIELVDDMTVRVTFREPTAGYGHQLAEWTGWLLAPSFWDDPARASAVPISTGPFRMDDWLRDETTTLIANDDYWRTDADGRPLPYLDGIEFRPMPDVSARLSTMRAGDADVNADSFPENLAYWTTEWIEAGNGLARRSPDRDTEYVLLNASAPPFDDREMRRALALCTDRDEYLAFRAPGTQLADGPFAEGAVGYLADTGFPRFDPAAGSALLDEIGRPDVIRLGATNVPAQLLTVELFADQWSRNCGLSVDIDQYEQAEFITRALTADYDALLWRNHGGGNPALETVWWHSRHAEGLATNFGRIVDPEIDRLMEALDATDDPDELDAIAQDVNRRFADEVYNLWLNTGEWALPYRSGVHGVGEVTLASGSTSRGSVGGRVWLHEVWIEA